MTTQDDTLKPCEFCGAKGEGAEGGLMVTKEAGWFKVVCLLCMAQGPDGQTIMAARERWNTRSDTALAQEGERLKAEIEPLRELASSLDNEGHWAAGSRVRKIIFRLEATIAERNTDK